MKSRNFNFELLVLCFSFFFTLSSHGQLFVDAGNDTTFCTGPNTDSLIIGANVKIENGVEPYTIAWECEVNSILGLETASDILNDSTLISPTIINGCWVYTNGVKFTINVTDSVGNYAKDSINVGFSGCGCVLGYQVIFLNKGDSTWLDAGIPGGRFTAFYWEPSDGLTDPGSASTWCKPDTTTDYFIVSVDTFGCTCSCHSYEIRIITTNSEDFELHSKGNINPCQKGTKVYFNNAMNLEALISLFSLDGKLLHESSTFNDNFEVSRLLHKRGIYIVKISIGGNIGICKFLKD